MDWVAYESGMDRVWVAMDQVDRAPRGWAAME